MIKTIKEKLLEDPDKIIELMEFYGFDRIKKRGNYLYMARDSDPESSPKSITIKLVDNDYLKVYDRSRNYSADIFSFIEHLKGFTFKETISYAKEMFGIEDYYYGGQQQERKQLFGGFYSGIRRKKETVIRTYPVSILNQYEKCGNMRFIRDGISLDTQKVFDIGYDVINQVITIPIYSETGDLVGVKVRANKDTEHGEMKYWYDYNCDMSKFLYGMDKNYNYMVENTVVLFEAEKSVMQCYDFGFRNAVSLGSSSVSERQCQLIFSMNPSRIILAHDEGIDFEVVKKNLETLRDYNKLSDVEICYWDSTQDIEILGTKSSLSDLGKERFEYGLENELIYI